MRLRSEDKHLLRKSADGKAQNQEGVPYAHRTGAIFVCFCQMAWQGIEAPKNSYTIEFPAAPSFFSSKQWIKLIPKTIGNRKKRLCVRLRSGNKRHLRKSADRKAQIRKAFVPLTGLIRAFRSADFLRWCLSHERKLTHNLFFLFPIVFGINLFYQT